MISNIYTDINTALAGLDLKQAKEFFSFENVPDSITDKSYFVSLPIFDNGNITGANARSNVPIFNIQFNFKINLCRKTTANKVQNLIINTAELIESIIKAILTITVGEDEKDNIEFVGSESIQNGVYIVSEISFNLNYRITTL